MYVNRLPQVTLSTDSNSDKYNKTTTRAYDPFQILQVIEHTLTVYKNVIRNTTSMDRATPVKGQSTVHAALTCLRLLWKTNRLFVRASPIQSQELLFQCSRAPWKRRNYFPIAQKHHERYWKYFHDAQRLDELDRNYLSNVHRILERDANYFFNANKLHEGD